MGFSEQNKRMIEWAIQRRSVVVRDITFRLLQERDLVITDTIVLLENPLKTENTFEVENSFEAENPLETENLENSFEAEDSLEAENLFEGENLLEAENSFEAENPLEVENPLEAESPFDLRNYRPSNHLIFFSNSLVVSNYPSPSSAATSQILMVGFISLRRLIPLLYKAQCDCFSRSRLPISRRDESSLVPSPKSPLPIVDSDLKRSDSSRTRRNRISWWSLIGKNLRKQDWY